jgi:hypothetical protein
MIRSEKATGCFEINETMLENESGTCSTMLDGDSRGLLRANETTRRNTL